MKTLTYATLFLLSISAFNLSSCRSDDDAPPLDPLIISGVYPNSNPTGGPVLIEGKDFTAQTKVYFNNVEATVEERSATFLTTKVPAGIGAGPKTIRIEDGNRLGTKSFDVLTDFPSDLPTGPPSIVIPIGGVTAPIAYSLESVDKITVMNVYDITHVIRLVVRVDEDLVGEVVSNEEIAINGTEYTSPVTFDGDPYFDFNLFNQEDTEVSMIEIHRSQADPANHPYTNDELSGAFTTMKNFTFSEDALQQDRGLLTDNFLLLTSTITGRQYLFVVLCFDEFDCG